MNKLPTNRSFGVSFIRGLCTFGLLIIVDMYCMQKDLDTIAYKHQQKKANFLFFGSKTTKILNAELAFRGIDFKGPSTFTVFKNFNKSVEALNLLAADYNNRGC